MSPTPVIVAATILCALACRSTQDRETTRPVVTANPGGGASTHPSAGAPPDFAIRVGGGPVAGWMAEGMTIEHARIEPRPNAPGEFDVVVIAVTHDSMGMPGPEREVRRAPVAADRVAELYEIVRTREDELEGPCMNPEIMDGATTSVVVRANGTDYDFRCTNATTPAFSALTDAFRALVDETTQP
jgi:hypothetical protein